MSAPHRPSAVPLPVRRIALSTLAACLLLLLLGARTLDGVRLLGARFTGETSLSCGFRERYGFDCLGCGGTRAFDRAAHGDFQTAFRFNRLGAMTGLLTWLVALGAAVSAATGRLRYLAVAAAGSLIVLPATMVVHAVLWWRALPPGFHVGA